MRGGAVAAIALAAVAAVIPASPALAAPPVNRVGHCLTPVAADGAEPPCNPFVASTAWSTSHRGSYAQGSSPYPAPHPGDEVVWDDISTAQEIPVILQFSEPYADGGHATWFSVIGVPQGHVYKIDYETGEQLGRELVPGDQPAPTTSGVYSVLDRDNHLIAATEQGLAAFGDSEPGVRTSGISLLAQLPLPARALCRSDDRIIGLTLTYDGLIAFATVRGTVGLIPREPERMTDANMVLASINGDRCGDASVPTADLEEVSNSISADDDGGIYVVTDHAQHRFDLRGGELEQSWRAEYETGGGGGGTTLSSGSGSTPDVVGTEPGEDELVAITDGQELAHLVLLWRDRIPKDWEPIAPGKDRRIACEHPVTFGDPMATSSISEQSVLTRGYSFVVVNNALNLDDAFAAIPPPYNTLSTLTSNLPGNTPQGAERLEWDPRTRTCHSVWGNPDVSIPNAIPTMSTESGLVYGAGVQNSVWGLTGLDWETGEQRMFVPTSPLVNDNSFFAATTIGPGGDVWIGGTGGINVFRGPDRPEPRLGCKDLSPPRSRVLVRGAAATRLHGVARDSACGLPGNLDGVEVSLARRDDGGCSARRFRPARLALAGVRKRVKWTLRLGAHLEPGRYCAVSRATDAEGNAQTRLRPKRLRMRPEGV